MNTNYALVTGGSRGIGAAICKRLAKDGYNILLNFRSNTKAANATKSEIEALGQKVDLLQCDISDNEAWTKSFETWQQNNPEAVIRVLVNNAGQRIDKLFMWMEHENWNDVMDTHVGGFFNVTKLIYPLLVKERTGRIVNVVSLSGIKGMPGQTNYSAAKAAIIGATKALAQEVGRSKITVNAVAPGFIKTDMTEDLDESQLKRMIPLKRFGTADEVAALVSFLASDEAGYITGTTISINGGLYT